MNNHKWKFITIISEVDLDRTMHNVKVFECKTCKLEISYYGPSLADHLIKTKLPSCDEMLVTRTLNE